jgi:hypothetical protein
MYYWNFKHLLQKFTFVFRYMFPCLLHTACIHTSSMHSFTVVKTTTGNTRTYPWKQRWTAATLQTTTIKIYVLYLIFNNFKIILLFCLLSVLLHIYVICTTHPSRWPRNAERCRTFTTRYKCKYSAVFGVCIYIYICISTQIYMV